MEGLFAKELVAQEFSKERFIDIPQEVQTLLKIYRPSPLVRASGLEKALDTTAKIYFKNESVSPVGSHKLNSAIPQAYYNAKQGIKHITTETGAGQWGTAMSIACTHFGLDLNVFMVRNSYNLKPYRKMMHLRRCLLSLAAMPLQRIPIVREVWVWLSRRQWRWPSKLRTADIHWAVY